jgi:hypothetical protein
MSERLLGIFGEKGLQLGPGPLVFRPSLPGTAKELGEFGPRLRACHVDDPNRLDAGLWRLDPEQARRLTGLDASPEFLLGRQKKMLVKRVGSDRYLNPFAAAGYNGQHGVPGIGDPHIVLQLGHILFGRARFRERPRQHELGLEHRPGSLNNAVEGGSQPPQHGVPDAALDVRQVLASIAPKPVAVEGLRYDPELDDEVAGQVFGFDFAPLFLPEPE